MSVYPSIGLQKQLFSKVPHGYWQSKENRRLFFDNLAKRRGFDPLVARYWYDLPRLLVHIAKGGISVLNHYGESLGKALMDLYPEVHFDVQKFSRASLQMYSGMETRRKFFDEFARDTMGFDPLVAENWYSVTKASVVRQKGGGFVLDCYEGSLYQALVSIYPKIGLRKGRFRKT